jgi:hypothetical protein
MDHFIHNLGFGTTKISYSNQKTDHPISIQHETGDTLYLSLGVATSLGHAILNAVKDYTRWAINDGGQSFEDAVRTCHVRSAIRRKSKPDVKYWKNNCVSLESRVPISDQNAHDWEEYDPREHKECSQFEEMPA